MTSTQGRVRIDRPYRYGAVLREIRKDRRVSLTDLSTVLSGRKGMRGHLGRVELGREGASFDLVVKWAAALQAQVIITLGSEQLKVAAGAEAAPIAAWVVDQKITLSDLATLSGVSIMTLIRWGKGEASSYNFATLSDVVSALDGTIKITPAGREGAGDAGI